MTSPTSFEDRSADAPWHEQQPTAIAYGALVAPGSDEQKKWGGLAFCIGEDGLLTELTSLADVLECPPVTPVPGTHDWFVGICNVRGKLYSVVDFGLFLGVAPPLIENEGTLLVINNSELGCTLLVPKVGGLRYFLQEQESEDTSAFNTQVQPFLDRSFVHEQQLWGVLSLALVAGLSDVVYVAI